MQDPLADRVAKLERSNRRLMRWLVILTSALAIILPFALVAGMFFMPFSVVKNAKSGQAVYVSTFGEAAVMNFNNKRKERRLELGVVPSGTPTLHFLDRNQRPRIALWVNENDIPNLMLYEPGQKGGFIADLTPDGRPQIRMRAPVGEGTINIGFLPDGNPVMRFVDKDGKASDIRGSIR
jgi:hypothetical protein